MLSVYCQLYRLIVLSFIFPCVTYTSLVLTRNVKFLQDSGNLLTGERLNPALARALVALSEQIYLVAGFT